MHKKYYRNAELLAVFILPTIFWFCHYNLFFLVFFKIYFTAKTFLGIFSFNRNESSIKSTAMHEIQREIIQLVSGGP